MMIKKQFMMTLTSTSARELQLVLSESHSIEVEIALRPKTGWPGFHKDGMMVKIMMVKAMERMTVGKLLKNQTESEESPGI